MNLWRRIVGLSLAAVMALSMLAPAAHAEETEPSVADEISVEQLADEQHDEDFVQTEQTEMVENSEIPEEEPADEPEPTEEEPAEAEEPAAPAEDESAETEESTDPDEEQPAEEEITAVKVSFICEPEELTLTVYPAVSFGEREAIQPEEDGTYLLMPGDYLYTAECELWETAENVEFTVEQGEENVEIEIQLEPTEELLIELFGWNAEIMLSSAPVVSRDDGIWLWPLPAESYKWFSDWAGCNGAGACVFHGYNHGDTDSYHTNSNGGNGHNGVDIGVGDGTSVYASADGILYSSGIEDSSRGIYIVIEHPKGDGWSYYSIYQHLSTAYTSLNGTQVSAGTKIGSSGHTGVGSGSHLHFEIVLGASGQVQAFASNSGYLYSNYECKGWVTTSQNCNGMILNNPNFSSPAGAPSGSSDLAQKLEMHQGSVSYTFDAKQVTVSSSNYIDQCTYYPCYVQLTPANSSHKVWSLPCSDDTEPSSKVITTTTDTLAAIALYKNTVTTSDHYWYKVKLSDGSEGYVYASYCNVKTDNETIKKGLRYSWPDEPYTLNVGISFYPVNCTVYSDYADLAQISGHIYQYGDSIYYNNQSKVREKFLNPSPIDDAMTFNEITIPGSYEMSISATVKNYYCSSKTNDITSETISKFLLNHNVTFLPAGASDPCASGHTWNSGTVTTQPTCTAEGIKTYTCTKCSATKTEAIPATGHTAVTDPAVAATCTTDGKTAGSHCSVCGAVITAQNTVAALGHDFILTETSSGSCTDRPYSIYTCSRCGETKTDYADEWSEWSTSKPENIDEQYIQTKTQYRHRYKETTTSTSSTLSGWTLSGTTQVWGEYGAWSDWQTSAVTASDSTQVESATVWGYYYYTCPSCGRHMHVWGTNACYTWAGGCGASIPDNFTGIWSTTSWDNANLKDWYGTGRYYTSLDGVGTVFKWSDNGTQRTSYRYRTRSMTTVYEFYRWEDWSEWHDDLIGANEIREVETRTLYRYNIYATASHSWNSGTVTKAATCTTDGVKTYTCTKCGETKTETIAKTGHTAVTDPAVAATCTTDGKTAGSHCSVCNAVITAQATVKATGHSWDSGTVTKAPTTSAAGSLKCACSKCAATTAVTLPKLDTTNYSYSVIKTASCSSEGSARYTWKDTSYGNYSFDVALAKLEHSFSNGSCTVCGAADPDYQASSGNSGSFVVSSVTGRAGSTVTIAVKTESNPGIVSLKVLVGYDSTKLKLMSITEADFSGASFGQLTANPIAINWVDTLHPNNTTNGNIALLTFQINEDAACGDTPVTLSYTPDDVYDYDFENVDFSICNGVITINDGLPGDVNSDGVVNNKDLGLMMRHLNGMNVTIDLSVADVNADGSINNKDYGLIQRYVNGWDVVLK